MSKRWTVKMCREQIYKIRRNTKINQPKLSQKELESATRTPDAAVKEQ